MSGPPDESGSLDPTGDPRVEWLSVAGDVEVWRSLGLSVGADGVVPLFGTSLRISGATGAEPGLAGWAISGIADGTTDIAGLPTETVEPQHPVFADHHLGAVELDHVVVFTGHMDAVSDAITSATGCERKRVRELGAIRQGFHRIGRGGLIVEVVEHADSDDVSGRFWGLVINVEDLDAATELLGPERVSAARDAVQPGRRIATIRDDVGLGVPVALMSRDPR